MQTVKAGIIGASGFSGLELTRLLAGHRHVQLAFATSDRWVGQRVDQHVRVRSELTYCSVDAGLRDAGQCDVVFLATPAETSLELVPKLLAANTRVIDLAGSFRLRDVTQYPPFYGFSHPNPGLVADAIYGLPELGAREKLKGAKLVANPGCYATAAALSVAPLLAKRLVEPSLVITGASGVSGAGRKATEDFSFMEIDADYRAYKTLKHQHTPEIMQTLSAVALSPVSLVFTPHLLPMKRGILCTSVATLKPGVSAQQVADAYSVRYAHEPLITLVKGPDAVRLADVVNTPRCVVGVATDGKNVVAISAIDNLLKGAASQAVQNLNLMFGADETEGLT